MSASDGNIKVVVRVRPFNSRERDRNAQCIVEMRNNQTILVPVKDADPRKQTKGASSDGQRSFTFDHSYWSFNKEDSNYADQEQLFNDLGKPLLQNAFQGYNNCIFAYGQTGSGKSYSMMGSPSEPGVVPKICRELFEEIGKIEARDPTVKCTVEVSYLEIYNEKVQDLLNPRSNGSLKVREHKTTGPYVEDLAKMAVQRVEEIESLMESGNKARKVAPTQMNEVSSRSHAVFTVLLTQRRHDAETKLDTEKVAKISLVDLAGSERATSTGATGARLKEGAEINRSLSTLGRVIAALADRSGGKKSVVIPYRDSTLTWLLKDSLGGNSLTAMIAAISPADINFDETHSTLRYADSAKRIKNHAVVNEDPNARMIRELKAELAQLRSKLEQGGPIGDAGSEVSNLPLAQQMVTITQADGTVKEVSKAEIAEQLNQSEKLYQELNQTWEQKLKQTQEIQMLREARLEELGISITKGFIGVSTPRKMPHLVNLADDTSSEWLIYNILPGRTIVGCVDGEAENGSKIEGQSTEDGGNGAGTGSDPKSLARGDNPDILIKSSTILKEHCEFTSVDDVVSIVPRAGADIMIDGKSITEEYRLRTGSRIILGGTRAFKFTHPIEAQTEKAEFAAKIITDGTDTPFTRKHWRGPSRLGMSNWSESGSVDNSPSRKPGHWRNSSVGVGGGIGRFDSDWLGSIPPGLEADIGDIDEMGSKSGSPKRSSRGSSRTSEASAATAAAAAAAAAEVDQLRKQRQELEAELAAQKAEYERQIAEMKPAPLALERAEKLRGQMIRRIFAHWRSIRYVAMVSQILRLASVVKEAQVFSQALGSSVVFQLCITEAGQTVPSNYDLVLGGVRPNAAAEAEAEADSEEGFAAASSGLSRPSVTIRVVDFDKDHCGVRVWTVKKLKARIRLMRKLQQQLASSTSTPIQYRAQTPFEDSFTPKFTRIGEADVPLTAVFASRVQDCEVDLLSPFTSSPVGVVSLSLEPSNADAPPGVLKFHVVLQKLAGFAEREGTDVHAQLFVIGGGSSNDGSGENDNIPSPQMSVAATQMVSGFDESHVTFRTVHSLSLSTKCPPTARLRVVVYANVTTVHLEKLLSWDDIRDASDERVIHKKSRIAESEFATDELHDVLIRTHLLEIDEEGIYQPVPAVQRSKLDPGAFQLHQGLQRKLVVGMTWPGQASVLGITAFSNIRIGKITAVGLNGASIDDSLEDDDDDDEPAGNVPLDSARGRDVSIQPTGKVKVIDNQDGTCTAMIVVQWDSSAHHAFLLNRATQPNSRVRVRVSFLVESCRLVAPIRMKSDLFLEIRPRNHLTRPNGLFASMMAQLSTSPTRQVRSSVSFGTITIRSSTGANTLDLWRLSSRDAYVRGEEQLFGWCPRGPSLVLDYIQLKRRRDMSVAIESIKARFGSRFLDMRPKNKPVGGRMTNVAAGRTHGKEEEEPVVVEELVEYTPAQRKVLLKVLTLWTSFNHDGLAAVLRQENIEPPSKGVRGGGGGAVTSPSKSRSDSIITGSPTSTTAPSPRPPSLFARYTPVQKAATISHAGFLVMPDPTYTVWMRRWVELRHPYLHIYGNAPTGMLSTDVVVAANPGHFPTTLPKMAGGPAEELMVVNLTYARVDHNPEIARLLSSTMGGSASSSMHSSMHSSNGANGIDRSGLPVPRPVPLPAAITSAANSVLSSGLLPSALKNLIPVGSHAAQACFAVYGPHMTWLFGCPRGEREKVEWILKIDEMGAAAEQDGGFM